MSNYVKSTDFASKDALITGNPSKVVRGTEIDVEFEAIETAVSSKADLVSPTLSGSPAAPTQASNSNNTLLATTAFVRSVIPAGIISLWSGSTATIPVGWNLCDGSNGTPDLRDRFIVGAGTGFAVGAVGGARDAVVVTHNHTAVSTVTDPGHLHNIGYSDTTAGGAALNRLTSGGSTNTSSATTGITVDTVNTAAGVVGTDANLPPYLALAYIMKI